MNFRRVVWVVAALGVCSWIASAQTAVEFAAPAVLSFPSTPTAGLYWTADIFGTAHPEILNDTTNGISIADLHPTNGFGGVTLGTTGDPETLEVGDIDQDGDNDIVVRTEIPRLIVVLRRQPGQGQFTSVSFPAVWRDPVHLADIDGDGSLDILCGGERWMNDGQGNFGAPVAFSVGASTSIDVLAGDIDGDGDTDLVSTFLGNSSAGFGYVARIIRQNAGGTFTLLTGTLIRAGATFGRAKIADINADGKDDLVYVTNVATDVDAYSVNTHYWWSVLTGGAGPVLSPTTIHDAYFLDALKDFAIADIDQDGYLDLALPFTLHTYAGGSQPSSGVTFLNGTASGALVPAIGAGLVPGANVLTVTPRVTLADDDLDGAPDLFLLNGSPQGSLLARNVPPSPVVPKLREAIGADLCLLSYSPGLIAVSLTNGVGGPSIRGRRVTATFQSGTQVSTFERHAVGFFEFPVPAFAAAAPTALTISIAEGPAFSGTFYPSPLYVMSTTTGSGQTTTINQPFAAPVGGRLTNAQGQPLVGVRVQLQDSPYVVADPPGDYYTDSNGDVAIPIRATGTPITGGLSLYCGGASVATVNFTVGDYAFLLSGGGGQTACIYTPFPTLLSGILVDATGQPVGGTPINFANTSPAANLLFSPPSTVTLADGSFATTVIAQGNAGAFGARITTAVSSIAPVVVFSVQSISLSIAAGDAQADYAGETLALPLTVFAQSCGSLAGATVTFTPSSSAITVSAPVAPIDAAGYASTTATLSSTASGALSVLATSGPASVTFHLVARRFRVVTSGTTIVLIYVHEHGGVPLALAAELASMTPTIPTPWGVIRTSILSPGPSFVLVDGLGLYGPVDSSMITNTAGSWTRVLSAPPPLGQSFTLQMYGYDAQAAYPRDYIVSNTASLNL